MQDKTWKDRIVTEEEEEPAGSPLSGIPVWFWVMLVGVGAIIVGGVAVHMTTPVEDGTRGTIALVQLVLGVISFLVAHGVASHHAMKVDPRVNMSDVLLSWFNVWQTTIAHLPKTCLRLFGIVWGLSAALTAVVVIGGIDYSAPFRVDGKTPRRTNPQQAIGAIADAARAQANEDLSMEESLQQLDDPEKTTAAGGSLAQAMKRQPPEEELGTKLFETEMHCVVYGVLTDEKQIPGGLLFAGNTTGTDQHVAKIDAKNIPRDDFYRITVRLHSAARNESVVPSTYDAAWVEPTVMCRVLFESVGDDGELVKPKFAGIVVNQRGRHR